MLFRSVVQFQTVSPKISTKRMNLRLEYHLKPMLTIRYLYIKQKVRESKGQHLNMRWARAFIQIKLDDGGGGEYPPGGAGGNGGGSGDGGCGDDYFVLLV